MFKIRIKRILYFCTTLIMPTEENLKRSISDLLDFEYNDSMYDRTRKRFSVMYHEMDSICQKYFECDLRKKDQLNRRSDIFHSFVRNCECEKHFRSAAREMGREQMHFIALTISPKLIAVQYFVRSQKFN